MRPTVETLRAFLGFGATSVRLVTQGDARYWSWVGVLLALVASGLLAYADQVTITDTVPADAAAQVSAVTHECRMFMPMSDLVDLAKEKARMEKELGKNRDELSKLETKLGNPGFVSKAPANVIEAERDRCEKLKALIAKLEESVTAIS